MKKSAPLLLIDMVRLQGAMSFIEEKVLLSTAFNTLMWKNI